MPSNTQEYQEIPESKEYNQKYPILYFSTPTWPKPNRYPVFFQMPDPTRYWKTLPVVGHCSCRGGEVKICFFLLQGFNLAVLAQALAMLAFHVHFFMLICLHYVQGSVQVFAKCCRVTALVVPRADNSQRQNLHKREALNIPHICHFFTQAKFSEKKIYTKIYTVNCQFTQ